MLKKWYKQSLGRQWPSCLQGVHYDPNLLNLVKHGIYSSLEVTDPPIQLVKAIDQHLPQMNQLIQNHKLNVQ